MKQFCLNDELLTLCSFFSFVSIPLEMLLYIVEHYKTPTPPPVTATQEKFVATRFLTEKEEERISRGTFLGTFPSQWHSYDVEVIRTDITGR